MTHPTYPAARLVADAVQGHFARHIAARAGRDGGDRETPAAPRDRRDHRRRVLGEPAARRRPGAEHLAGVPAARAGAAPLMFASRLPLAPAVLAKVAPAVERPGIHLGVWRNGDEFFVWGTTREVPAFCLVVEVVASGLIVIKHRSEPFGKFVNVAVLEGDQIKIVDEGVGR